MITLITSYIYLCLGVILGLKYVKLSHFFDKNFKKQYNSGKNLGGWYAFKIY